MYPVYLLGKHLYTKKYTSEAMIFAVMNAILEKPEQFSGLQRDLNPRPRDTGAML